MDRVSFLDFLKQVVMGNVAGPLEQTEGQENSTSGVTGVTAGVTPTATVRKKPAAPPKLPIPPEDELEERFNVVLVSSDLHANTNTILPHVDRWTLTQVFLYACTDCALDNSNT